MTRRHSSRQTGRPGLAQTQEPMMTTITTTELRRSIPRRTRRYLIAALAAAALLAPTALVVSRINDNDAHRIAAPTTNPVLDPGPAVNAVVFTTDGASVHRRRQAKSAQRRARRHALTPKSRGNNGATESLAGGSRRLQRGSDRRAPSHPDWWTKKDLTQSSRPSQVPNPISGLSATSDGPLRCGPLRVK